MKKIFLLITAMLPMVFALSQVAPTNNSPTGAIASGATNVQFWSRAGNAGGGVGSSNNIFGTLWNSPIYTQTMGLNRMKLNGNVAYSVNGFTGVRNGYLLLGPDQPLQSGAGNIYGATKGAFSLLHLNGGDGTQVQELGYRDWMRTGITFTGNNDLSYFGLRQMGGSETFDQTETVIAWSDNQAGIADELAFRFIGQNIGPVTTFSNDFSDPLDVDGLHVGRFSPFGRFGLGNSFGHIDLLSSAPNYATPASLFHMSYQFRTDPGAQPSLYEPYGFMQITYRRANGAASDIIGQGEAATDGLRFGIDNEIKGAVGFQHLNGFLRWQEASSFIFQTKDNSTSNIQNNERMRITSVGALAANYPTTAYIGNILPSNSTRISFSYDGANPITKPLSLLHLGYDLTLAGAGGNSVGWRPWMNIGTFLTNGSDHMYIGLKEENGSGDKLDAVINWGDNSGPITATGPDNLRFIFTAPANNLGLPVTGQLINGLEGMRMTPTLNSGIFTGIGGSTGNPYFTGTDNPNSTLEVNSWGVTTNPGGSSGLRFTNLTTASPTLVNPGLGVLSVNADGEVIYVPTYTGGNAFVDCADNTGAGNLVVDSKVNLNNKNLFFENNDFMGLNHVGIGINCGAALPAKLSVRQNHPAATNVNQNTIGISGVNSDVADAPLLTFKGVYGEASGVQVLNRITNFGGDFRGTGGVINYGVRGFAQSSPQNSNSWGGYFTGWGGYTSYGSTSIGVNGNFLTFGAQGSAITQLSSTLECAGGSFIAGGCLGNNMGVRGDVNMQPNENALVAYGVYGTYSIQPTSLVTVRRAGYFNGHVEIANGNLYLSDQQFKSNVFEIENGLETLNLLKPKTYYFDTISYPQINLTSELQYGFIAQEIETVIPDAIHNSIFPAQYDSLGVEISPAIPYKSMNYNAIIPINTAAIKELDREVQNQTLSDQTIKTNVVDLNNSLNKVLAMRGISYDWTTSAQTNYDLDSANHVGFIAQEVQQVDARLTFIGRDSLLHVEYEKVVPILVEAIEELNDEVETKDSIINDMNARLSTLENCLSGILPFLCQLSQSSVQANTLESQEAIRAQLSVKLTNKETIVLDQNVPNPFAEQTVINFSIPETVQKAQIHFYNAEGRIIQSVDVLERGLGSLTVFGSDLSTGVYTYTLVADGISVATKKMMKN